MTATGQPAPVRAGQQDAALERMATPYEIHTAEQFGAARRDLAAVAAGEARRIIRVLTRGSKP